MAKIYDLEHKKQSLRDRGARKGFDPGLSNEWWCVTNINEQMGLMEEKNSYATDLDQLMSERGNVMDYIKGLRDQRDELNQEIRATAGGPVLQSLTETFEVVRRVPLQEQNLIDNLQWDKRRCG